MALFGNPAGLSSSKNLVEFRAGKMNLRGTTVTPDKRKGLVYIHQSEDSLMHFCWKDRTNGKVEDDLIIFPDDIEFKRINQCTSGRVYILKFKSSSRKFFFWMQEPKTDKDDEYCKKVNETLNNPPTPGSGSGGGGLNLSGLQPALASLGDQLGDSSFQSVINNMDQNQLMQLLGMTGLGGGAFAGGDDSRTSSRASAARESRSSTTTTSSTSTTTTAHSTPATTTPATTTQSTSNSSSNNTTSKAPSSGAAVQLSDLQSILSNMQVPASQENVDLAASFSTEALLPLLSDKDVQDRLKPFLPAVKNLSSNQNELRETISSPQFKQALSTFSVALSSGELAPLMQQFKLSQPAIDAAAKGDVIAFVKALQEAESKGAENADEEMALD